MRQSIHVLFTVLALSSAAACAQPALQCPPDKGVALQVLGSGGPIADDGRASAAYIVWLDGRSRIMIDAGGGAFLRFGEAGAKFTELDFVGLSHFHTDHSADFPALLKSGNFSGRERPLAVAGPGPGGPFPGLSGWLDRLVDAESGAYAYLSGYLDGSGGLVKLEANEIDPAGGEPVRVIDEDVVVDALPVPHGIVPALGFRVRVRDTTVVFASDQNGSDPAFIDFAAGADVLVMHLPIPEGAEGSALQLHARPSTLGRIASEAGVGKLVLSHWMARSLEDREGNLEAVRKAYDGEIDAAEDRDCFVISD